MWLAFITGNSSLEPFLEGLDAQIHFWFELTGCVFSTFAVGRKLFYFFPQLACLCFVLFLIFVNFNFLVRAAVASWIPDFSSNWHFVCFTFIHHASFLSIVSTCGGRKSKVQLFPQLGMFSDWFGFVFFSFSIFSGFFWVDLRPPQVETKYKYGRILPGLVVTMWRTAAMYMYIYIDIFIYIYSYIHTCIHI